MKLLHLLFITGLLSVLSACSTFSPSAEDALAPQAINWKAQQQRLKAIAQWTAQGRIAVQTETNGGQADFHWSQQDEDHYAIRLQAPLGAGTTWIESNQQGVSLRTSSGDSLYARDVDRLMRRVNGWPLPVSGLRYWVLGLPSADRTYQVSQWNEHGLPQVMLQDGWRIEFRDYTYESGLLLPHKLFIRRLDQEISVRLIIRQWQLAGATDV